MTRQDERANDEKLREANGQKRKRKTCSELELSAGTSYNRGGLLMTPSRRITTTQRNVKREPAATSPSEAEEETIKSAARVKNVMVANVKQSLGSLTGRDKCTDRAKGILLRSITRHLWVQGASLGEEESKVSATAIAEELGVDDSGLRRYVRQARREGEKEYRIFSSGGFCWLH